MRLTLFPPFNNTSGVITISFYAVFSGAGKSRYRNNPLERPLVFESQRVYLSINFVILMRNDFDERISYTAVGLTLISGSPACPVREFSNQHI